MAQIHGEAMDHAEQAEVARLQGDAERASELFRQAFELERTAAEQVRHDVGREPTRSVLLRSAASLALDCRDIGEAERLIGIALGGAPPAPITRELRELGDQVAVERYLETPGASLLEHEVVQARDAYEPEFEAVEVQLAEVASDLLPEMVTSLAALGDWFSGDLFQLVILGAEGAGKSTLVGALLGSPDAPRQSGSLPTRFTYAREAGLPAVLAPPEGGPGVGAQPLELQVGWPAPLLQAGVSVVDMPGTSKVWSSGSTLLEQALLHADVTILVHPAESFLPQAERAFVKKAAQLAGGSAFTVVNRRGDAPAGAVQESEIRDRLGVPYGESLREAGVYIVDLAAATEARVRGDEPSVARAGLLALERRVARVLVEDRYRRRVAAAALALERDTVKLAERVQLERELVLADVERTRVEAIAIRAHMYKSDLARDRFHRLIRESEYSVGTRAVISYQDALRVLAQDLPYALQSRLTIGRWRSFALDVEDAINGVVAERMRVWASNPPGQPGLRNDLWPFVEDLADYVRAYGQTLGERIGDFALLRDDFGSGLTLPDPIIPQMAVGRVVSFGLLSSRGRIEQFLVDDAVDRLRRHARDPDVLHRVKEAAREWFREPSSIMESLLSEWFAHLRQTFDGHMQQFEEKRFDSEVRLEELGRWEEVVRITSARVSALAARARGSADARGQGDRAGSPISRPHHP